MVGKHCICLFPHRTLGTPVVIALSSRFVYAHVSIAPFPWLLKFWTAWDLLACVACAISLEVG